MIGQRLSETLRFWSRNIPALLIVTLPFALAGEFIQSLFGPALAADEEGIRISEISAVLILLLRPFAEGAIMAQLLAIQQGRIASMASCLAFSIRAAPVLLMTYLMLGAGVYAGLLLFIFPGAWLYARLCQAPYIAVLESRTPVQALGEAWRRSASDQWQILGAVTMVFLIVVGLFQFAGMIINGLLGTHVVSSILLGILTSVISCMLNIIVFRYYGLLRPAAPGSTPPAQDDDTPGAP